MVQTHLRCAGLVLAFRAAASSSSQNGLSHECTQYLHRKNFSGVDDLADHLHQQGYPCVANADLQQKYHPNPLPGSAGGSDTTDFSCRYGNPEMLSFNGTCCGWRPHFNWVVGTCEGTESAGTESAGKFCSSIPKCARDGAAKINYVAAYQFDGTNFVLMDESSAGDMSSSGIDGNFWLKQGWERIKQSFRWNGGDWTTKYAPWANGIDGHAGPRGVTPPAGLWVLSAENFYYSAFFMLPQVTLNLEGKNFPTVTNCWMWELDPVEGTLGWVPHKPAPGNINHLYSTNSAQASGCMPFTYSASQSQAFGKEFKMPAIFKKFCSQNPKAAGCRPWELGQDVSWSGGWQGSQRFENLWDTAYVFAIVVDAQGYWIYRWRPDPHTNSTGWEGISRHFAARVLPPRPKPVTNPAGLKTDVRGDVDEAVILQPSVPPAESCMRSSIEPVDWQFGSAALGAMACETGQGNTVSRWAGAQNWWTHFTDLKHYADYPMSISGLPFDSLNYTYTCNTEGNFSCSCRLPDPEPILPVGGFAEVDPNYV